MNYELVKLFCFYILGTFSYWVFLWTQKKTIIQLENLIKRQKGEITHLNNRLKELGGKKSGQDKVTAYGKEGPNK